MSINHNFFNHIPHDILTEMMIYFELSQLQLLKQLSKTIYSIYYNIISDNVFLQKLYNRILCNNGYTSDNYFNNNDIKQIRNLCIKLSPIPGNVSMITKHNNCTNNQPIRLSEPIVNIFTLNFKTICLGKSNKLYVLNNNTNLLEGTIDISLPITNIIEYGFCEHMILSNGKIYIGKLLTIGTYLCTLYKPTFKLLDIIDNVIDMVAIGNEILFHTLAGKVYKWNNSTLDIFYTNAKYIARCANYGTCLKNWEDYTYIISSKKSCVRLKYVNFEMNLLPQVSHNNYINGITDVLPRIPYDNHYINGTMCGDHIVLLDDKQDLHNTQPESYILKQEDISNVIKVVGCDTTDNNINNSYNYYIIIK